ncbi:MAG TPA: MOSC N-terminal beta barrel domain-containing protein [Ktedonobacterales bacterium]|nr:MOSC N-terminal beta barrel domain-containing protein [Ktedonobacterales bacterium]
MPEMAEVKSTAVGVVRAIYRYPVKSMRGESLAEASVEWQGIAGDRCYAFVQSDDRSTFPYLTAREVPDLLLYTPTLTDPSKPYYSPVFVRTPEGLEYPIESEELHASIARHATRPFYLLRLGRRSTHDIAPLSLITTSTITSLGNQLGMEFDPRRFRPTILVETPDEGGYPEEQWVGGVLVFGDDEANAMQMRVSQLDIRCKMITLDPQTAAAEPRVLAEVVRSRGSQLGVYGLPQRLGALRVGQTVHLLPG